MARQFSNTTNLTTLVSSIDSSQVSIVVNDTSGFPVSFPFSLILDYQGPAVEVVTVTNLSGSTLTVTRGQDGTSASAHDAGTVVAHGATARDLAEPQAHIDATTGVHGLAMGSALVGTAMTQTLTNKTISAADNTLTGVVTPTEAQTLTNKTIAFADNALTGVASLDATQTLTNKTISGSSNTVSNLNTSVLTGGTLGVARGGTGLASFTTGNYLRASGSTTLAQRTPTQVKTDLDILHDSFTPSVTATTNPNLGANGSAVGWYTRAGQSVAFQMQFTFDGSGASAGSGAYNFFLPFTLNTSLMTTSSVAGAGNIIGSGLARSASGGDNVPLLVQVISSGVCRLLTAVEGTAFFQHNTLSNFASSNPSRISLFGTFISAA